MRQGGKESETRVQSTVAAWRRQYENKSFTTVPGIAALCIPSAVSEHFHDRDHGIDQTLSFVSYSMGLLRDRSVRAK